MNPKPFFLTSITFALALLLAFPFQAIHAQVADSSDASSTPAVDISEASSTPNDQDISSATSTDPTDQDEGTTTAPIASSTDATTTDSDTSIQMFALATPVLVTPAAVTINLDVESPSGALFDGPITVSPCTSDINTTSEVTAYCAIQQSGLSANWTPFAGFGEALASVNGSGDWNNGPWWTLFSDGQPISDSADNHVLTSGETFLATDGPMPLEINVSSSSPSVGATTIVTVEGFNSNDFDYEPLAGATIVGANVSTTDANGQAVITATSSNAFTISATASGYIPSTSVTITPIASASASTIGTAHLLVRDGATIAYDGMLTFPIGTSTIDVLPTNSSSTIAVSNQSLLGALVNLQQTETDFSLSDLDYYPSFSEFYLNCVAFASASTTDCGDWQYQVDGTYPYSSIDQYQLQDGDTVNLYFGSPRQVVLATSTVPAGTSFVATAESYDPTTNTYGPAAGYTIGVTQPDPNNPYSPTEIATSTADANGQATFTISTPGNYDVGLEEDSYFPSTPLTITASATSTDSGSDGSGGSSSSNSSGPSAANAFAYLTSQQLIDGSFPGGSGFTGWAAIALSLPDAPNSARTLVANYLKTTPPDLSVVTDYERYAMALMSLGINPYSGTDTDYITPIVNAFNGTQIGDSGHISYDIFALIVLPKAGFTSSDTIIQKEVAYVVSQQSADGSWYIDSPDLTGAAIQALSQFTSLPGVSAAISKAESYLHTAQQSDGGFGNVAATSWVLDGLAAVGQSPTSWVMNGSTPLASLAAAQQSDGGFDSTDTSNSTRVWDTSYALTAIEGRSWTSLMQSFAKPASLTASGGTASASTTATSTLIASTTPFIVATSTPITASSTILTATSTSLPFFNLVPVKQYAVHGSTTSSSSGSATTTASAAGPNVNSLTASASNAPAAHSLWSWIGAFFGWISSIFEKIF